MGLISMFPMKTMAEESRTASSASITPTAVSTSSLWPGHRLHQADCRSGWSPLRPCDGGTVSRIDEYEPVGAFIRTITLSTQDVYVGIGVTASGDIFMAAQSSYIYHFNSQGDLINQISTNCALTDMALAANGTIIAKGDGRVSITDERLAAVNFLRTSLDSLESISSGSQTISQTLTCCGLPDRARLVWERQQP